MMGKVRWKRTDGEEEEEGEKTRVKEGGEFAETWISLKNYISMVVATKMSLTKIDCLFMFYLPRKNSVE